MAKVKMSKVAGMPVRTLRRIVGIPAHRPSGFNACIGAALRGKKFSAPPGEGGQNNTALHNAFTQAARSCGGRHRA